MPKKQSDNSGRETSVERGIVGKGGTCFLDGWIEKGR